MMAISDNGLAPPRRRLIWPEYVVGVEGLTWFLVCFVVAGIASCSLFSYWNKGVMERRGCLGIFFPAEDEKMKKVISGQRN